MLQKGLALKTLSRGFYSGEEVVKLHQKVLKEKGRTYFSTGIRIHESMAPMIEDLILYSIGEDFFYVCHVEDLRLQKEKWLPEDAECLLPEPFQKEPERAWFLLSSIEEMELDAFKALSKNTTGEPLLKALQKAGRANAIYFRNRKLI